MIYRISFGNQTNIGVHTAGQVWYGKARQVATSGKSAFSPEYGLTAT